MTIIKSQNPRAIMVGSILCVLVVACEATSFSSNKPATSATIPNTAVSSSTNADSIASTALPTPPTNAVTKGSFTAWTNPSNPAPYQNYQITIRVTLPSSTTNYQRSDLSGQVQGTDAYVQGLGTDSLQTKWQSKMPESFQVSGNIAQLTVWVPGTYSGVVDTITISSALLGETQNLSLLFGDGSSSTPSTYGSSSGYY